MFLIRFSLVFILMVVSIAILAPILLIGAACRVLHRKGWWWRFCSLWIQHIYLIWVDINRWLFHNFLPTKWDIKGSGELNIEASYLMLCNHIAWVDIMVLHSVFERKAPPQIYFLKDSLRWLPFAGQVCWALEYIFIKRFTLSQMRHRPELRQEALASLRGACHKFSNQPVTIVNFAEGSRFTPERQQNRQSPYQYLLQPEGGGAAAVLSTLADKIDHIIDVTIIYDADDVSAWTFLTGRIRRISLRYNVIPVTDTMRGDYFGDRQFRRQFQAQLCKLWQQKDQQIKAERDVHQSACSDH